MNASATNLMMVVMTWTEPMFLTPERLIAAGIQSPTSTSSTVIHLVWPLLMKSSTYSTQPTAIAALPAHAVIQYDQALTKPRGLPNAGPRVGIGAAVGGQPPGQRGEQHRQRQRADGGQRHRDQGDRAVARERRRQVEDADADDAADDQRHRRGQPELRRAFPARRLGSRTRRLLGNVNLVSHF